MVSFCGIMLQLIGRVCARGLVMHVPGARIRACGLVYALFVAQTTWFGMPDVYSAKGEWVEHVIEGHKVRDSINIQVCFRLGEELMGHMKLLLSKGVPLIRDEVG